MGSWRLADPFHARDIPNLMHLQHPCFVDKPFGLVCHVLACPGDIVLIRQTFRNFYFCVTGPEKCASKTVSVDFTKYGLSYLLNTPVPVTSQIQHTKKNIQNKTPYLYDLGASYEGLGKAGKESACNA